MKIETILMDSPLYFTCPITGEVIIDEENEVNNEVSIATEFIYYDGEFEFKRDWVEKVYGDDLVEFLKSQSYLSENVICYELVIGSGISLDKVYVGIRE